MFVDFLDRRDSFSTGKLAVNSQPSAPNHSLETFFSKTN